MNLLDLLKGVEVVELCGNINKNCENIEINSNNVEKNSMFICLKGSKYNGNSFVSLAITNGANVIVSEKTVFANVTTVKVKDARIAFAKIAANYYGNPAKKLKVIAVVGTNGKTTTSYIAYKLLNGAGYKTGLVGTMYIEYNGHRTDATLTTPDPLDLNRMLKDMLDNGIQYVIMEVSAHAIFYNKLFGIDPYIKLFTNFSQDHLDFFKTMSEYKECKKSYFFNNDTSIQVINIDDSLGLEIANESKNEVITYGLTNPADVFCIDFENKADGSGYILNLLDSIIDVTTRLFGVFNVYNTMGAAICAKLCGVSELSIGNTLQNIEPPEGRFNVFEINNVKYVVDFAHTPDGLFNLLKEARQIAKNRIITIFGCGGDRDVSKRPIMGRVAKNMSDIVILTTDNPRTENRRTIVEDIMKGIKNTENLYVELDRKKAIKLGASLANNGDIVLIAGKGCEKYIDENNTKVPYSDIQEVYNLGV